MKNPFGGVKASKSRGPRIFPSEPFYCSHFFSTKLQYEADYSRTVQFCFIETISYLLLPNDFRKKTPTFVA